MPIWRSKVAGGLPTPICKWRLVAQYRWSAASWLY